MPDSLASGLFFIVGTGRCGTTLLRAMLCSHSRIDIPPETKFFQRHDPADPQCVGRDPLPAALLDEYLARYFASPDWINLGLERGPVEAAMRGSDRSARALFLAVAGAWAARHGKPRLGEKTPLHCRRIYRIRVVFPDAKFIHLYRDPRDVVASMLKMEWARGSTRDFARDWRTILAEHRRYERELPPSVYTGVRYETLLDHPEEELRRLCAFLGETFEPAMLDFQKQAEANFAKGLPPWQQQTKKPLNKEAVGRFLEQLTHRQIAQIERLCGPLMTRLGYEPIAGWRKHHPLWMALDGAAHVRRKAARSLRKRIGGDA